MLKAKFEWLNFSFQILVENLEWQILSRINIVVRIFQWSLDKIIYYHHYDSKIQPVPFWDVFKPLTDLVLTSIKY